MGPPLLLLLCCSFVFAIERCMQVEQCQTLLKENGVNLTLTVVDTPGFGDAVDNSNWYVFPR